MELNFFHLLGIPPYSYWPQLKFNENFESVKAELKTCGLAKFPTSEEYDIRGPLKSGFNHFINKHWLGKEDAFDLLVRCLQPQRLKRISAEDALKCDFLDKRKFVLNELVKNPVICPPKVSEGDYWKASSKPAGGEVEYINVKSSPQPASDLQPPTPQRTKRARFKNVILSHLKVSFPLLTSKFNKVIALT